MLDEAIAGLAPRDGGVYVDATFGRGGHSSAILERIGESGRLHALDQDPEACQAAWRRFGSCPQFRIHRRNFGALGALAGELGLQGGVHGLLVDQGVSSPQFDDAERGFSFAHDGPLDMRMDPDDGVSAATWLASASAEEIAEVLWRYGEERASRRIARRLVEARTEVPITRTVQLAELIARAVPGPRQKIHPATRSFQAIRIHINGELDALQALLGASVDLLAPGGRLVVISFHSLEDRIVKRFMRETVGGGRGTSEAAIDPVRALYDARFSTAASGRAFRAVGRQFPSEAECAANPRARSAVLRIAERLS